MSDAKRTIAYLFLAPMLGLGKTTLQRYNAVNAYFDDGEMPEQARQHIALEVSEHERFFCVLFADDPGDEAQMMFFSQLRTAQLHVVDYDVDDGHVMFVFRVPITYAEAYDAIEAGKYSEVPSNYRDKFFNKASNLYRVLTRDPSLREYYERQLDITLPPDAEVYDRPDPAVECFRYRGSPAHS